MFILISIINESFQIKREITILRNVSHPNIINCYEYFYLDQHIYVVMEYAANGTLGTALQNALTRRRYFSELVK